MNKIKKIFCAVLAFILVGMNMGGCISTFAADGDASGDGVGQALIPFDKVWDDETNPDNRPSSIELSLYKYLGDFDESTAALVETVNVAGPTWHYDFDISSQALQNSDGESYKYKIIESLVEGYTESAHVDPTVEFIPPTGDDDWERNEPCSELDITNVSPSKNPIVASKKGNKVVVWSETALTPAERDVIRDSLKGQQGIGNPQYTYISGYGEFPEYGFEVTPGSVSYSTSSNWSLIFFGGYSPTSSNITPATITNKLDVEVAESLTIEKTFSGVSAAALSGLTFTITGPSEFGTNGEMTVNFTDCDLSDGKATCLVDAVIYAGDYTVKENGAELDHFTLTATGDNTTQTVGGGDVVVFSIDNQYVVDTTTYTVTKQWDDDHDRDGLRPGVLSIELLANGDVADTFNLSSDNVTEDETELPEGYEVDDVWTYTWEDLPVANEDAEEITYSVSETINFDGYEKTDENSDDVSTTFTNTHVPELVNGTGEITVTKIWDDANNKLGIRPNGVFVKLLADGEELLSATISEDENGDWIYTFEGLYKNSGGSEIEYSVEEGALSDDYSTTIEGNAEDGFVITNRSTDPCVFGGCGGDVPFLPPESGFFTANNGGARNNISSMMVGLAAAVVMSVVFLAGKRYASLTK